MFSLVTMATLLLKSMYWFFLENLMHPIRYAKPKVAYSPGIELMYLTLFIMFFVGYDSWRNHPDIPPNMAITAIFITFFIKHRKRIWPLSPQSPKNTLRFASWFSISTSYSPHSIRFILITYFPIWSPCGRMPCSHCLRKWACPPHEWCLKLVLWLFNQLNNNTLNYCMQLNAKKSN